MGRSPCCEKEAGLKKGPWTPEEDQKLLTFIEQHGHGCWRSLPAKAGLRRCGKSCRLRWTNYLRPDIKRGKFTLQEEQTIIQLHALLGNRWSAIATHLPKRTDNEIKNYWNTHLKKRLAKMGIDPVTHKPRADAPGATGGAAASGARYRAAAHLSHTAQWESARLEAEARLAREAKLRALASPQQPPPPGAARGLESPTSTLSFSEGAMFAAAAAAHDDAARAHVLLTPRSYGEAFGEHAAAQGFLAGVLLDCSAAGEEQTRFAAASTTDASAGDQQQQEEEDKGYWSSILNMVNSSMSSSSSSLTSDAVTDPAMYFPAAAEF